METKEITKTIYIANDGKEFLTKEDCEKHERFVEEILSRIKYFCIRCNPDLTETGNFSHKRYCISMGFKEVWYLLRGKRNGIWLPTPF